MEIQQMCLGKNDVTPTIQNFPHSTTSQLEIVGFTPQQGCSACIAALTIYLNQSTSRLICVTGFLDWTGGVRSNSLVQRCILHAYNRQLQGPGRRGARASTASVYLY